MNYTAQMENALWQKWNELDEDFDNTATLDFLNDEDEFRTFGDGLIALISKKYPDADLKDVPKFLAAMCPENNMDINAIVSRNTLKNWFEGDKRPKKGETDREHMYGDKYGIESDVFVEVFRMAKQKVAAKTLREQQNMIYVKHALLTAKKMHDEGDCISDKKPQSPFNM